MSKESHEAGNVDAMGGPDNKLEEGFNGVDLNTDGSVVTQEAETKSEKEAVEGESVTETTESSGAEAEKAGGPTAEVEPVNMEPMQDLRELYAAETIQNPDAVFDVAGAIEGAEGIVTSLDQRIVALRQQLADAAEIDRVRGTLGSDASEVQDTTALQAELEELEAQKEEAIEMREQAESLRELQEVMDQLVALKKENPAAIIFLINNGTMPDGEQLKTKSGQEIKPDVVKGLAKDVEAGVTMLTKAVVKAVLSIVKGIIKGVFKGIAAAMKG